jgi:hypothetical protein
MLTKNGENGHLCLVPDLREKELSFSPFSMLAVAYYRWSLSYWCMLLLFLICSAFLSWRDNFYQELFLHRLKWACDFCLLFCWLVHAHWFMYVEPSLYHLVMVGNLSNVLLYSVCQDFVEDFCICVHQGYWPVVFFYVVFLTGFGIRIMLASYNMFGRILSFQFFGIIYEELVLVPC